MMSVDFKAVADLMRTEGEDTQGVRIDSASVRKVISLFTSAVFPGRIDDSPLDQTLAELYYDIREISSGIVTEILIVCFFMGTRLLKIFWQLSVALNILCT